MAAELRTLLNEELHARAQESGRSPDEALALSLVRGFGRPNEVAARYQPVWTIIDPADSRSFARAAIIGAGSLLVLSALTRLLPSCRGSPTTWSRSGSWPGSASWLSPSERRTGFAGAGRRRRPGSPAIATG